jgi:hypothetical protein
MVALDQQAHPLAPRPTRLPPPDQHPRQATTPHQVWFMAVRYLTHLDGHWL